MNRISISARSCSARTSPKYARRSSAVSSFDRAVVDREVRQVEEDVAHARVLPVDDADASAVVDEVGRQEVVVARTLRRRPARALDEHGRLAGALVGLRHRRPRASPQSRRTPRPRGTGRTAPGSAARLCTARNDCATRRSASGSRNRLRHDHVPADEPRHEIALRLDEGDHLRPDADGRRCERRLVLDPPVDPEQLGVLATDPKHVGAVVERDLEVAVRDPAAEHLDLASRPGQTRSTISSTRIVGRDPRISRISAAARGGRRPSRTIRRRAQPRLRDRHRPRRPRGARRARSRGRRRPSA